MTLLIIDDHAVASDMLKIVASDLFVAFFHCRSIPDALREKDGLNNVQMVAVDYDLLEGPVNPGFDTIKGAFPQAPIVITGGRAEVDPAIALLKAGAAGYLPRTMGREGVLNAFRLIVAGERFVPALAIEGRRQCALIESFVKPKQADQLYNLTPRQREVLGMVASGAPNKVIARALSLQEVTVKSHLRTIYRVLRVTTRTEAARKVMLSEMKSEIAPAPINGGNRQDTMFCH